MHFTYKLTTDTINDEEGSTRTVYGIAAYENSGNIPTRTVSDVFTDKTEAERFINACNALELDIDHLDDVIYDVLNS